jgi:hypothetical protein
MPDDAPYHELAAAPSDAAAVLLHQGPASIRGKHKLCIIACNRNRQKGPVCQSDAGDGQQHMQHLWQEPSAAHVWATLPCSSWVFNAGNRQSPSLYTTQMKGLCLAQCSERKAGCVGQEGRLLLLLPVVGVHVKLHVLIYHPHWETTSNSQDTRTATYEINGMRHQCGAACALPTCLPPLGSPRCDIATATNVVWALLGLDMDATRA